MSTDREPPIVREDEITVTRELTPSQAAGLAVGLAAAALGPPDFARCVWGSCVEPATEECYCQGLARPYCATHAELNRSVYCNTAEGRLIPCVSIKSGEHWHRAACSTCRWLGQWWEHHAEAWQQALCHDCATYWRIPVTFTTPHGEEVTIPAGDVKRWADERENLSNHGAARAAREALARLTGR